MKQRVNLSRRVLKDGVESLYLDYYLGGKRVRENLKLYLHKENTASDRMKNSETMRIANAVRDKKEYELEQIDAGIEVKSSPVMIPFKDYAFKKIARMHPQTRYNYTNIINRFDEFKPNIYLQEIDSKVMTDFIHYLQDDGRNPNTIRVYVATLKTFFTKAVNEGILQKVPNVKDAMPKGKKSIRQFLTMDEVRLLEAAECGRDIVKKAFLFCCFTGLRWCDVTRLTPSMIADNVISIRQQKTSEPVRIPLSVNAKRFLPVDWEKSSKIFNLPINADCDHLIYTWVKRAGIDKRVTFHCSRHTFAVLALSNGADIYVVSQLLGHTDVKTTQIYAKAVDSARKKAVNLIPEL